MSLRLASLAILAAFACAPGKMKVKKGEPQTAREKMLAEEAAKTPEAAEEDPAAKQKWTGWRYQGDRKDCFFVVGRKCFKTQNAACQAAKCKAPSKCETEGAGPATLMCSGTAKADEAADDANPKADDKKSKEKSDDKKSKEKSDDKRSKDEKSDDKKPRPKKG